METQQLYQLKINSTNIKSSLISYNKQLRKLRLDENKLLVDREKRSKIEDKEKRLEAPGKGLIENIKSRIVAGPMSFFDKVKEFFGIILIGVAINNLPAIVSKVSEVGKTLIDVANSVVGVITATVNGINGFISIIQSLPETTKNKLIEGKNQLEQLILDMNKIIDPLNEQYTKFNKDLNSKSTSSSNQPGQPNPQPSEQPQGKAKGGTISNIPPKEGTGRGSPTDKANVSRGTADTKVTSSPYARPGGSPKLRQARQSYNAFGEFSNLSKENKENYLLLGSSSDTFGEVNKSFETFLTQLRDLQLTKPFKTTPMTSPASQQPIPTTGQAGTVSINTSEVIGTVGYTGFTDPKGPDGSHLHIERVGDYKLGIPGDVKKNILVEGVPMTSRLRFTSGIGFRWGRPHKGEDYAGNPDQRITLTGGLKFLKFMPDSGSGYGNQVYIEAPDGSQYTLNHLNSGPANLQQLLQQQKRQQQIQQAPVSPYQVQPNQQGPTISPETSFLLEEEEDIQIVMINTTQQIIQQGKTRTVVVNSSRKDPFPSESPNLAPLPGIWNPTT